MPLVVEHDEVVHNLAFHSLAVDCDRRVGAPSRHAHAQHLLSWYGVEREREHVVEWILRFANNVVDTLACLQAGRTIGEPHDVALAVDHGHVHYVVRQGAVDVGRAASGPVHLLVVGTVVAYAQVESRNAVGRLRVDTLRERGVHGSRQCVEGILLYAVAVACVARGACQPDVRPHEVAYVAALCSLECPYAVQVLVGRVDASGQHGVGLQKLVVVYRRGEIFRIAVIDVAYGRQFRCLVPAHAVAYRRAHEFLFACPCVDEGCLVVAEHLQGAVGKAHVAGETR